MLMSRFYVETGSVQYSIPGLGLTGFLWLSACFFESNLL